MSYPIGTYATVRVDNDGGSEWPVVERVPGGWQSGSHHYPDASVRDVRPLLVADARRIIEVAISICDAWDERVIRWPLDARDYEQGRRRAVADCAYELREAMAVAGSGFRPMNRCACDRHRGDHSQCYAGCDLSGCRSL